MIDNQTKITASTIVGTAKREATHYVIEDACSNFGFNPTLYNVMCAGEIVFQTQSLKWAEEQCKLRNRGYSPI